MAVNDAECTCRSANEITPRARVFELDRDSSFVAVLKNAEHFNAEHVWIAFNKGRFVVCASGMDRTSL